MEVLSLLVTSANAFLHLTISRNVNQSPPESDNMPEEEVVGISCVLHRNCVDGRWRNLCACSLALAEWIDRNELWLPIPSYARTTMYERPEMDIVDNCQACLLPAPASLE